ncbi:hypothetical protein GCM10022408_04680 [Hymenobacter fastidiosus]|uniref:UspA domain-containing protein n=1 Tax=Hymenobacter fastidiosus TaxID=486264 RepID=A0ABP7RGC3_9BACT
MTPSLLVLTDFFQAANGALDYAATLAPPLGARLVLLHVQRDSLLDPERFSGEAPDLEHEDVDLGFQRLIRDLPGPVAAEIGHGQVADAIAESVRHHHPTLLVLGRPNSENTPDELVTTTSLDILRAVPYPMLVVPHPLPAPHPPRRVLVAVDGEPFTLGAHAATLRHLLDALQAELTVVQVVEGPAPEEIATEALNSVLSLGLALPQSVRTRSVSALRPAEGILRVARPTEFDMVILIARPRSFVSELFHHSVTAQVLRQSPIPVLVLPAQE